MSVVRMATSPHTSVPVQNIQTVDDESQAPAFCKLGEFRVKYVAHTCIAANARERSQQKPERLYYYINSLLFHAWSNILKLYTCIFTLDMLIEDR